MLADRIVVSAREKIGIAQIGVDDQRERIQLERVPSGGDGFLEAAPVPEQDRVPVVCGRIVRLEPDAPLEVGLRILVISVGQT